MSKRPLIVVDVDGVLIPFVEGSVLEQEAKLQAGWIQAKGMAKGMLVNPAHGAMLRGLADETGGELVWGSAREREANAHVAPLIGLGDMPVLPVHETLAEFGSKLIGALAEMDGRPFVWFDDDPWVRRDAGNYASQPHLVIRVNDLEGLTPEHIDEAREWLLALRPRWCQLAA